MSVPVKAARKEPSPKKKIAVIGAGPMGIACAYQLLKQGHEVEIFERDDRLGGMTAAFDFGGLKIERFYHFICATDFPYFALLKELGIWEKLIWRRTKMGFFYRGKLYPWSDPVSLLRFPHLSLFSKIRYCANILYAKRVSNWKKLDRISAAAWLKTWLGKQGYEVLWDNLLRLKYHEFQQGISAAWIAARIQRIARSRESVFHEKLGYLEGGSQTWLDAMDAAIEKLGGKIHLSTSAQRLIVRGNRCEGIIVDGSEQRFDDVISTIPLPYVPSLAPELSAPTLEKIAAIRNVGVVCVLFKLKRPFSQNFWTNINDYRMELPGIIEYSNLYPMQDSLIYLPYYMPQTHAWFSRDNAYFIARSMEYLQMIQPGFSSDQVLASHVSRYQYAQTVCTPDFFAALPPMRSSIENFYMADTAYYYPEDRSISESIKCGNALAALI